MDASPDSIRVVGEADLLALARVARSTWRNWIKQGVLVPPKDALYRETDIIEAVLVATVIDALDLRLAAATWPMVGERLAHAVAAARTERGVFLIADPFDWGMEIRVGANELASAVRQRVASPRSYVVVEVGAIVAEARNAFWKRARPTREFAADRRRANRLPSSESGRNAGP